MRAGNRSADWGANARAGRSAGNTGSGAVATDASSCVRWYTLEQVRTTFASDLDTAVEYLPRPRQWTSEWYQCGRPIPPKVGPFLAATNTRRNPSRSTSGGPLSPHPQLQGPRLLVNLMPVHAISRPVQNLGEFSLCKTSEFSSPVHIPAQSLGHGHPWRNGGGNLQREGGRVAWWTSHVRQLWSFFPWSQCARRRAGLRLRR
jgi:hypothetical protein